jgi:protein-L-isoaspartate(D-aspartate) O-methyltransferase
MIDYAAARLNMVESQLRPNKITDEALLDAFLTVPRERFVPETLRGIAYIDEDIPLGGKRFLVEPMVLGRLLQIAAVRPGNSVLEIGAATGYATAILSRLARSVVAVESDARLRDLAQARLKEMRATVATLVDGPLEAGYAGRAPYDVILIDGAVALIPDAVASQLAEGGRLVTVLRPPGAVGRAVLMTRIEGVLSHRPVFDAATPLLPGFLPAPSFAF